MSAEVLREAASLMRERAAAATEGPWEPVEVDGDVWGLGNRERVCRTSSYAYGPDAEHIASWHPAVALAVADLLDLAAGHEKREGDECGQGYTDEGYGYIDPSCSICGTPDEYAEPWPCAYVTRGLAVARAYLGEALTSLDLRLRQAPDLAAMTTALHDTAEHIAAVEAWAAKENR